MFRRYISDMVQTLIPIFFTHLTLVHIQYLSNACLATSGLCSRKHLRRDSNFQTLMEKTESVLFKNQPNSRPKNKMYPIPSPMAKIYSIFQTNKKKYTLWRRIYLYNLHREVPSSITVAQSGYVFKSVEQFF